jgi:predicted outer membrane repeat protein
LTGLANFVGSWLRFEDNRADGRGGAIAVEDSSNLILRGGPGFACTGPNCSGIFGSRGITEGESASLIGGAVYAENGSTVSLRQQKLFQNHAVSGSALSFSSGGTNAVLHSVLIARNFLYGMGNEQSTVHVTGQAAIRMRFVTMVGNLRASAMFPGVDRALSSLRAFGAEASVSLHNSLFWNDGYEVLRTVFGPAVTGSCVLAHENDTFAPASIADPMYVNTFGDSPDFRLQPGSPAIDRCAVVGGDEADVRGRARPQDLALPNLDGSYDAGAYEALFLVAQEPAVFSDGFEQPLP